MAVCEHAAKFKSWVWKRQLLEALSLWHCAVCFLFSHGKRKLNLEIIGCSQSSGSLQTGAGLVLTFICLSVGA